MRTRAMKIKEAEAYKGTSAKEWRDLFGFSIVRNLGNKQLSLTHYNKKVSCLQLNLSPGLTCPGSTPLCRKCGYCHKVEYDNVLQTYQKNTDAAHDSEIFIQLMTRALHEYARHGGKWFRFHSYGDFFSQYYLVSIYNIVEAFPHIQFLAHTKSYKLDFTNKPDNLAIYFSVFPDSLKELEKHNPWGFPYALAGDVSDYQGQRAEVASTSITCPAGCNKCRICWKGKKSVRFNWH